MKVCTLFRAYMDLLIYKDLYRQVYTTITFKQYFGNIFNMTNVPIMSPTAHVFFDDAFEISDVNDDWSQVNRFVKLLVSTIDDAASHVHETNIRIRAPTKYPTPYGGRLVWTLPGKTKMICHLKDKSKIRHRKRWSQVSSERFLKV